MWPPKAVLHPTDFSDCSQAAFNVACSLARDYEARLLLLHVTSIPDLAYKGYGAPGAPLQAEDYLADVTSRIETMKSSATGVHIETLIREGNPAAEIVRVARDRGADLIVMGSHGQTGLAHLLMGSVAESVAREAPCAVLSLRMCQAAQRK